MPSLVDNVIALRILYMLVQPFEKTDAYKYKIIDSEGKLLVKASDIPSEQKAAYTYLHRIIFKVKQLIEKVPGGDSQLATLAASYMLVRESMVRGAGIITESRFSELAQSDLSELTEEIANTAVGNISGLTSEPFGIRVKRRNPVDDKRKSIIVPEEKIGASS
jgi:hypothetical protein